MIKRGMQKKAACLWMLTMALAFGWNSTVQGQTREPLAMPVVEEDSIMKHIIELSSENYAGRMAGTQGYDEAVRYVERVLMNYGIKVSEQLFEVECNEVENCKFNTYLPGTKDKRTFILGNDFCCAGMTGRGYVDAQIVFVGYGIDDEVLNDYKYVDVQGKIVVVLTGLPEGSWLPASVGERYATLRDKARTAEKHGALGMLAINMSPSCLSYEPQGRVYCGALPHLATFPILQLTLDSGRELFLDEPTAFDDALQTINKEHKIASFAFRKKAEIDVNAVYRQRALTANVIGILEGSDRRYNDELIVVGASLDHVGIQGETALFPGADVNASGVAAVLETARLLSQERFRPKRSIAFVLFSGSEQQWMGSRIFLRNFKNLRDVEAFINIQNIGYGDSIVVLGDACYPALWEIAQKRDESNHSLIWTGNEKRAPRGDARAFDQIGIPSLVFTTLNGLHHNHVSSDIWENIDRKILTHVTQVTVETVRELCDGLYQGRSMKSKALRFDY